MEIISTNAVWLGSFLDRREKKKLHLGAHQEIRGDVWTDHQKDDWWNNTIVPAYEKGNNAGTFGVIGGLIVTYSLADDKNKLTYLNDGANRTVHSLISLRKKWYKKEKKDYFDKVLRDVQIFQQHRIYEDEPEAVNDFIRMNSKGTAATPYEILQAKFVANLPDYVNTWEPIFEKIQQCMVNGLFILGYDTTKDKRETFHKWKRDNLAHFLRFATHDRTKWSPTVTGKTIDKPKHHELEDCCLDFFKREGADNVLKKVILFDRFLQERLNLYKQIRLEQKIHNVVSTPTAVRWWLAYAIYHHNNNYEFETLRTFTEKYFELHHGRTTLIYQKQDGERTNITTQLQKMGNVSTVYRALLLKPDEIEKPAKKRKKPKDRCVPGWVHSHLDAFSTNGNGETMPENALENAKRSAANMTETTKIKVKKANGIDF